LLAKLDFVTAFAEVGKFGDQTSFARRERATAYIASGDATEVQVPVS
jgi:hypothetical protein